MEIHRLKTTVKRNVPDIYTPDISTPSKRNIYQHSLIGYWSKYIYFTWNSHYKWNILILFSLPF